MPQKYLKPANRICSVLFILSVIVYVFLCFQSYRLGEINYFLTKDHNGVTVVNDWVSSLKSVAAFGVSVFVLMLYLDYRRIRTSFALPLTLLLLFCVATETIVPSSDGLLINRITSQTLWIIVFFGFCAYFMGKSKIQIEKFVRFSFWFVFVLFIINYVNGLIMGIEWSYIEAYYMLTLLPLIILFIKKKNIYFIMTFVCLILAAKRTGLITYCVAILYYYYSLQPKISNKIKVLFAFLISAGIVYIAASAVFPNQVERVFNRFSEIEEDGGSGRDLIFERVCIAIFEGDTTELMIGHGYNTVVKSDVNNGYSAHNDFLEVLYDFGFIGFILYMTLYYRLWSISKSTYLSRIHKIACKQTFIIMFLLSLTSHLILFTTSIVFLIAFISYSELTIFKAKYNLV